MVTFTARKAQHFFRDLLDPLQHRMRNLFDRDQQVEALYLSAHIVTFAIRRGLLRDVLSFMDERREPGIANPIQTAARMAQRGVTMGHHDLAALPAATSIVGLGGHFGLRDTMYEEVFDRDEFARMSDRILIQCRDMSNSIPTGVVAGMLASTARIASLDNLPESQDAVIAALDSQSRHLMNSPVEPHADSDTEFAKELALVAKLAQEVGDADTSIAFDLIGDSKRGERIEGLIGVDPEDVYFPMYKTYREIGQTGTAALLFDAAIESATASKSTIAKMLHEEPGRTVPGRPSSRRRGSEPLLGSSGPREEESTRPGRLVHAPTAAESTPVLAFRHVVAEFESTVLDTVHEPVQTEQRHVNAWIEDGEPPLETMRAYRLGVNVGKPRTDSLTSQPLPEPDFKGEDSLELLVVVSGRGFSIKCHQQKLTLPRVGDSEVVHFEITPLLETLLLRISVFLCSDLTLIEEFEIPVEAHARTKAA